MPLDDLLKAVVIIFFFKSTSDSPGKREVPTNVAKLSNKLADLSQTKIGKYVANTARIGTIASGVGSAGSIIGTGLNEGFEYTNPDDFRNMLMAGAVSKT